MNLLCCASALEPHLFTLSSAPLQVPLSMSGSRRKHVVRGLEHVEAPTETQRIVHVIGTRGGNIVEVCELCLCATHNPYLFLGAYRP